ncbi:hypothetical protein FN846DRAFT_613778 [Sphaerosporella brunnea]|uniref:Secreted protein n=1 Tax=Sphaerosporella brunnea TaxID=1250544 RepID=A0A5J5EC82_9PEZI|nr:hypothetical protein FN846DRAFT_613778 [Sphaerosporella brunnea]
MRQTSSGCLAVFIWVLARMVLERQLQRVDLQYRTGNHSLNGTSNVRLEQRQRTDLQFDQLSVNFKQPLKRNARKKLR